ncbi:MAG TPA: hypothetical protein VMF90_05290 [Rhizobiaceae bacterium]|nr:hypothetical protein [Rhizobiaceae bacterium]
MHTTATVTALTSALTSALGAIPSGATNEEAYKAFMAKLGEGLTDAFGAALGAAVGVIDAQQAASPNSNWVTIGDLLRNGSQLSVDFSSPGLTIPSTRKVSSKQGMVVPPSGGVSAMGGSVGVTGSYSF